MAHLQLYVGHLAPGELKLVERDSRLLQEPQEAQFLRAQDQQGVTDPALASRCSPHTVDVLLEKWDENILRMCNGQWFKWSHSQIEQDDEIAFKQSI